MPGWGSEAADFYGFPVELPVQFEYNKETVLTNTLNGRSFRSLGPTRGRVLQFTVRLPHGSDQKGDDGMDLQTRLEWLAETVGGSSSMPMLQNVPQAEAYTAPLLLSAASGRGSERRFTAGLVAQGSRTVSVGRFVSFSSHNRVYKVYATRRDRIMFTPGLAADIESGDTVDLTPTLFFAMLSDPNVPYERGPLDKTIRVQELW